MRWLLRFIVGCYIAWDGLRPASSGATRKRLLNYTESGSGTKILRKLLAQGFFGERKLTMSFAVR